jgi:ABC-type lipoprotein release transport system permease subunit
MSINHPRPPALHKLLQRVVLGFGVVGTALGTATVVIVYRTMNDFHAELMQRADAARDQLLLDAIARDSRTMILVLAAIVPVATLNIVAGFIMLMRGRPQ